MTTIAGASDVFQAQRRPWNERKRPKLVSRRTPRVHRGLRKAKRGLHKAKQGLHKAKHGLHEAKRGLPEPKHGLHKAKLGLQGCAALAGIGVSQPYFSKAKAQWRLRQRHLSSRFRDLLDRRKCLGYLLVSLLYLPASSDDVLNQRPRHVRRLVAIGI